MLSYALHQVAAQAQRAIEAVNVQDVVGARIEIERLTPPLIAAGRVIRKLENATHRARP
jgi:hypothetical protein